MRQTYFLTVILTIAQYEQLKSISLEKILGI